MFNSAMVIYLLFFPPLFLINFVSMLFSSTSTIKRLLQHECNVCTLRRSSPPSVCTAFSVHREKLIVYLYHFQTGGRVLPLRGGHRAAGPRAQLRAALPHVQRGGGVHQLHQPPRPHPDHLRCCRKQARDGPVPESTKT